MIFFFFSFGEKPLSRDINLSSREGSCATFCGPARDLKQKECAERRPCGRHARPNAPSQLNCHLFREVFPDCVRLKVQPSHTHELLCLRTLFYRLRDTKGRVKWPALACSRRLALACSSGGAGAQGVIVAVRPRWGEARQIEGCSTSFVVRVSV